MSVVKVALKKLAHKKYSRKWFCKCGYEVIWQLGDMLLFGWCYQNLKRVCPRCSQEMEFKIFEKE